jgi:Ca-activated chloride channel family protein
MRLEIMADRRLARAAARSNRYLLATLTAPAGQAGPRLPVNISLVLDRSGSMGGDKIVLARQAAEQALRLLGPEDRFSVVIYDTQVDVLVQSTLATPREVEMACARLRTVEPRGGTDLAGGWLRGCEQIARFAGEEKVNRCLLLTDGQANAGITEPDALARHATELYSRGVQTSTFGVGDDFNELLLEAMARAGRGNFYFIESPAGIPALMASELDDALEVVARGVVLEVRAPAGAAVESLHQFPTTHGRDGVVGVELGVVVARQRLQVAVRIELPAGRPGEPLSAELTLRDRDGRLLAGPAGFTWELAGHPENDAQPHERQVDRAVATVYAARARAAATEHNRAGDYERARQVLRATAHRIRGYAGNDAELRRIASELEAEVPQFATAMGTLALKEKHFEAYNACRSRDVQGRTVKPR